MTFADIASTRSHLTSRRARHAVTLSGTAVLMTALAALATPSAMAGSTSDSPPDSESKNETNSVLDAGTTRQTGPVVGEVTRIAGLTSTGGVGFSGDGGPATDARLNDRLDVAAAPDGTIYLADRGNRRVRAIDPEGTISTVVRAFRSPENDVDVAEGWTFSPSNTPFSVDVTEDGTLVVGGNDDIRMLTTGGETTVLAGGGEEGIPARGESKPGTSISLHRAHDVAAAADGTVYAYVADAGHLIEIDPDGTVRLLAGGGEMDRSDADGSRPATDYAIGRPSALTVADSGPRAGTVFFTAELHSQVMAISPEGTLDVFAGTGENGFSGDGGPARNAQLSESVEALAVTPDGDLLIGDTHNAAIRQVDDDGVITTLRGAVGRVTSMDVLPDGDVVFTRGPVALRLTMVGTPAMEVAESAEPGADPFADAEAGEVLELAGAEPDGSAQPTQVQARQLQPHRNPVTVDADGAVLYGDNVTGTVRRVESDGGTTVVVGAAPPTAAAEPAPLKAPDTVAAGERVLDTVQDLATTTDGRVLIAERHHIWELSQDGAMLTRIFSSTTSDDTAMLIRGITTDTQGNVYAAVGDLVLAIAPDGTAETLAGGGERWADDVDGHPATEAALWEPTDVAVDSTGTIYLTENGRPHVRQITPDGTITTVLGDSYRGLDEGGFAGDVGPGTDAEVNTPLGLVVTDDDVLFVADSLNARVRRLDPDGTVTTVAGNGRVPADPDSDGQQADEQNPDGPALETALGEPASLALDHDGNLLISATRPDRLLRLTGDDGLRVVADIASEPEGGQTPAAEAVLQGVLDVAVGPDGLPHLGGMNGVTTIDDTALHVDAPDAHRITSGAVMAVAGQRTVSRVLPDGRTVLVAGGGAMKPQDEAVPALSLNLADGVTDVAAGPDGSVLILASADSQRAAGDGQSLYEVTADGLATPIHLGEVESLVSIAAGPDGVVYGIDGASAEIVRLDDQGAGTIVVARDEENTEELVDEPFGTATALPGGTPQDLAVGVHGNLFVTVGNGVLVVDPEEDTYSFHDTVWSGHQSNLRVAADLHGNAYLLSRHEGGQAVRLSALAHPAEVTAPTQIPWTRVGMIGGGSAVLLGAVFFWRKRNDRASS